MGTFAEHGTPPRRVDATLLFVAMAGCGGPNRAPLAPEIDIEPAIPHTQDNLRLVVLEPAIDPDGDALVYHTRWFQNGEIRDRVRGAVVPAARTQAGEYWIAEMWASDGMLESPVVQATAYVFNTAPEVSVRIQPDQPATSDDLVAHAQASDLDEDEVQLHYSWSVDGEETEHSGPRLAAEQTAKHQRWTVEVLPYDGDSWGHAASDELVIGNTAPGAPQVGFSPEDPRPERQDVQCAVTVPAEDPDGDALEYRVSWELDGEPFDDCLDTALVGDTVPAEYTARGQRWECWIWADDGEGEGPPGRAVLTF